MEKLNILLIEDNRQISLNIDSYFAGKGINLDFASTGPQGLALALANYYDLIILDLMLPGLDGLQVCQALRQQAPRHIPVIMLTARDTLDDKLQGFATGADDYLSKPFAMAELLARCQVLARRQQLNKSFAITIGPLWLDTRSQKVSREGIAIELSPIPFKILKVLVENHPRPVSRSELTAKIWGDEPTDSDTLRSHIYQLRQALDKPFTTPMLKTIHGIGFALAENA